MKFVQCFLLALSSLCLFQVNAELPDLNNPPLHKRLIAEYEFETYRPEIGVKASEYPNPYPHHYFNQLIISKHDYTLEDHFDIDSDLGHLGNVIQSSLSFRKNYTYYDSHGNLQSSAYVRFFSLGTFFTSATAMDIYNSEGKPIGAIEGTFFTLAPAKFFFYDGDSNLKGIAYLDDDRCSFTVYHPTHSQKIIAIFTRIFVRDVQDWWVIDIIDREAIDYRILASFGAFAVDTQGEYKEDL